MAKLFKKCKKPYSGAILSPFCSNFGKMNFLGKEALSVFKYSNYLPYAKNQKKLMTHS